MSRLQTAHLRWDLQLSLIVVECSGHLQMRLFSPSALPVERCYKLGHPRLELAVSFEGLEELVVLLEALGSWWSHLNALESQRWLWNSMRDPTRFKSRKRSPWYCMRQCPWRILIIVDQVSARGLGALELNIVVIETLPCHVVVPEAL